MGPIDGKFETVMVRAFTRDEVNRKRVQKYEQPTRDVDSFKHIEKKLIGKGVLRQARHSGDGITMVKQPKSGHGGKYNWKVPASEAENEMDPVPPAIDEKDPNYLDDDDDEEEEEEEDDGDVTELVV